MRDSLINAIRQMLIQIFRPLVKILLRLNIPYTIVSDTLKWTYVDVAKNHFGINGKPPTKSRIAVITGLSRTQVDAQLNLDMINQDYVHRQWHRAGRVLTGWSEDDRYKNSKGDTNILPLDSKSEACFKELVDRYSGGATYRSIMDELLVSNAIKLHADKTVELINPFYITENDSDDLQKIDFLGLSAQYLIETIDNNIDPQHKDLRFQRIIMQDKLPKSLSKIAESYIRKRSQELANEIDEYLEHLVSLSDIQEEQEIVPNIGLGIYFYKSNEEQKNYP